MRWPWIALSSSLALLLNSASTAASRFVPLGDFPLGNVSSVANAVSADGSIVGGQGSFGVDPEAFVWDSFSGMQGLGGRA